ncbi:hypothetical protein OG206_20630 [Streptomyces sp. NBC_01341]|uniref:hypothetical protein n=1 Tax=Streptomyces sp. NBC_01341 TaxID=2903831 RepID=UPI002E10745C|nr:hypothetical protein OG206_20630 [Streptomyces sp. NBC_01341]
MKKTVRAAAGMMVAGVAMTGLLTAGAGAAQAAANGYINVRITPNATDPHTGENTCEIDAARNNQAVYGSTSGSADGQEYFYCTPNGDGTSALWYRYWAE